MEDLQNIIENANSQMRKGTLEFCILLLIGKNQKMYASDILHKLKDIKLIVVEGTLYPLLNRLKREEILSHTWEESKNGPPRKYYFLTDKGNTFLQSLTITWKNLNSSITLLLNNNE